MGFNCGIVGLPNVGKSTIFNALTSAGAEAANYPFCTIEPNTGIVPLRDARLQALAQTVGSAKIIPTAIEFVDIAGLVKGASKGEGLGNQFLGHIRSVDAIAHVVRCFEDENVTHVDGSISPSRDVDVIETELLLSDLESVDRRIERVMKKAKSGDKDAKSLLHSLEFAKNHLDQGTMLSTVEDEEGLLDGLDLLTAKPMFFVANVAEEHAAVDLSKRDTLGAALLELVEFAQERGSELVVISGKVESEISDIEEEERETFLQELGLKSSGLDRLAEQGYNILDLITFFTCGPKETRAWTVRRGTPAVDSAGVIHTDFSKGFIRAEVIGYTDFIESKGELGAKEKGLLRLEGKTYIVQDGDVMHFRFNV
jgi:GTP-binding protein YchF